MPKYAYVYVGSEARRNFEIGMARQVWGWKHPRSGPLANAAVDWLTNPTQPTYLAFVQGASPATPVPGWPRTPEGDLEPWRAASFGAVTIARLARPLYVATETVWTDDVYEYRVGLDSVTPIGPLTGAQLHHDALLAVRDSVLRQGRPMLGPEPLIDDLSQTDGDIVSMLRKGALSTVAPVLDDAALDTDDSSSDGNLPDRLLGGLDNLDGFARAVVRVEQRLLRRLRFGGAAEVTCAICGRVLPVGLVRLAHIKRRAEANRDERLMIENTMPACTLGCDELFERGYLVVDQVGVVRLNPAIKVTGTDLVEAVKVLDGRRIKGYSQKQEPFFAAHRHRHQA